MMMCLTKSVWSRNTAFCFALTVALALLTSGTLLAQPTVQVVVGKEMQQVGFGKTSVSIPFYLSAASNDTVTVQFATEDHTATAPADYTSQSDSLTFEPGETQKEVVITIAKNAKTSANAWAIVRLSNPQNAELGYVPYGLFYLSAGIPPTSISAEVIDQDDPKNKKWGPGPAVVYGGSIPSTADNLYLTAKVDDGAEVDPPVSYAWSVVGRGDYWYTPPGNTSVWDVGDLKPTAGPLMFTCKTTFQSGEIGTADYSIEIGIRSDDAVVVGWIDRNGVMLPVADPLTFGKIFPPDGEVGDVPDALAVLLQLSKFERYPVYSFNLTGLAPSMTNNDRRYLLNWLFRYANNPDPKINGAPDFLTDGIIDYAKVAAFRAKMAGGYKLFNHFQVKFQVNPNGGFYNLFKDGDGAPIPVNGRAETGIGTTIDPVSQFLEFPGQKGPNDGAIRSSSSVVGHINDGSPDVDGVNGFSELMGDTRHFPNPVYWESIGSRITFKPTSTAPSSPVITQKYPTYYLYTNGNAPTVESIQAAEPKDQFVAWDAFASAYPFGNNASSGSGTTWNWYSTPVPGGRNGDATSAPGSTSRIPPYVAP